MARALCGVGDNPALQLLQEPSVKRHGQTCKGRTLISQDPNGIQTENCVRWTKNTEAYALPTARRLEHPQLSKGALSWLRAQPAMRRLTPRLPNTKWNTEAQSTTSAAVTV